MSASTPPPPDRGPRRRRTLPAILALFALIILLTAAEVWLQGNPASLPVGSNILVFALVNLNVILLMVLALLVLRNLTKLYFERRRQILGARFRSRLAVAFVSLASIPALILFLVSLKLLSTSLRSWFDAQVEESLRGASELAADAYRAASQTARQGARLLAEEIGRQRLLEGGRPEALPAVLSEVADRMGLAAAEVYLAEGGPAARHLSAALPRDTPVAPPAELVRAGLAGEEDARALSLPAGDLLLASRGVRSPGSRAVRGAVVAGVLIPDEQRRRMAATARTYESYVQLRLFRGPIRVSFTTTLAMVALLITFSATWFAFYLARVITTPIQKLAEATRRVAQGDLDFSVEVAAQDEIGLLVESFNRMTRELRAKNAALEGASQDLQRINLELERRRNVIETILEHIATGVLAVSRLGTVASLNRSAEAMLGLAVADSLGRPYGEVLRDPALRPLREAVDAARASPTGTWEGRVALATGGQVRTLVVNAVPLRDARGEDLGQLVVCEDLTQLLLAQRAAAWQEAARRIAHEVKNPLTPIQLSIQRARKKFLQRAPDFEPVFLEASATVIAQVEAMRRLVDEFSRFARLPALAPAPVDLHAVIESALGLYRSGRRRVEFATSFAPGPLVIDGDAEQLRRVFINLIENALEAMDGEGRIAVATALLPARRTAEVRVSDTGRGLPPEDRGRFFLPDVSTKKEGSGLGLAIVSDIVAEHRGSIRAEDNLPRGTTFILEFPLPEHEDAATGGKTEAQHAG